MGYYAELNARSEVLGRKLRFNFGGRFVDTDQHVAGP
jgi:hypothetical protein